MDDPERDVALFRARIESQLADLRERWRETDRRWELAAERRRTLEVWTADSASRQREQIARTEALLSRWRPKEAGHADPTSDDNGPPGMPPGD